MAEHIMVVDDEAAIADLVEVYLRNEGYAVHKFYCAADALACAKETELCRFVKHIGRRTGKENSSLRAS